VYVWLIDSARRISPIEHVSLLAIALLILQIGFIAGVLIGVIIGCATFAVSASRVNAIKFSFDGSEYRSTLDRGPDELAILAKHGRQIQGMSLQSYLLFGSSNRLYQQVKALFASEPECRFLVFDFRLVTGIESSAMHSFTQISRRQMRSAHASCWSICRASSSTPSAPAASSPAMSSSPTISTARSSLARRR
jgi:SulP family sulfate permease